MKMDISSVTQTSAAPVTSSNVVTPVNNEVAQSKPQPTTKDTVQISGTAKTALQEASETAAQTAQETGRGDLQAQRQLSREEAQESPAAKAQEAQATSVSDLFK
jgi:hypothetical protein